MTADDILHSLRKYDFPRAYHTRFAVFGTTETDDAAAHAASVRADQLVTKVDVTEFLHCLWRLTSTALDHGEHRPEHEPALKQLEIELANMVMTLRGQVIPRF